ncbi:MAG: electron transport complex subunit RsxC [Lachnospiraceae bacterium]|nr:electron transport complex subunit RsxC [Lachnospiraceae bacterium]
MSILTFKGGIHPHNDGKDISKASPISEYIPQGEIVIPLGQHIGAPATPLVKKGDRVFVNQKIGEASGFISSNVHSSVSGTVKNIEPRVVASGDKIMSVIIENDQLYETIEKTDNRLCEDMTREEKLELIKEAGIVGMGGAGFPAHVKLSPKNADEIEYYIVNGAECEPYLTSDYRRMIETPELIIRGVRIALSLFKKAKGIIAIEDNKRDAIVKMKEALKGDPDIIVKTLYTKYPQGGERALIYATTGRMINSSMLPADAKCVVNNIDTVFAIYNAIDNKLPLTHRIVTISGDAIQAPQNFKVPIGTNLAELVEAAGGFKAQPEKLICGGPMMGMALYDLNIPVTKGTSALLCFTKDEVRKNEPSNCINCGRCVSVCPGRVMPARLAVLAEHGDKEGFQKLNGMECCECGCCSYICPAKRNLTQSIKSMRKDILADRKKK